MPLYSTRSCDGLGASTTAAYSDYLTEQSPSHELDPRTLILTLLYHCNPFAYRRSTQHPVPRLWTLIPQATARWHPVGTSRGVYE
ncbi:hypothetical protein FKP32DRAFT_1448415 [Trametes sanguinea]|nr:hypothetical protein FKP32DRAFT_1448415 [Trametes sanguinea]